MKKFTILILSFILFTSLSYAHSGRTDSNGGHYVRTAGNGYPVGSYHYHNSPAVTVPQTYTYNYSYTPVKTYTYVATPDYVYSTNIRTFIDTYEIPTFWYDKNAMIILEDLSNYGFNTYFDNDTNTLKIYRASDKAIAPVSITKYTKKSNNSKVFKVQKNDSSNYSAILYGGKSGIKTIEIVKINGYMLTKVENLSEYGYFHWDEKNQASNIWTK